MMRLVPFTAPWCSLSASLKPILTRTAALLPEGVEIAEAVDIDKDPDLPQRYGIKGLPALALVEGETLRGVVVGLAKPDWIAAWVREIMA